MLWFSAPIVALPACQCLTHLSAYFFVLPLAAPSSPIHPSSVSANLRFSLEVSMPLWGLVFRLRSFVRASAPILCRWKPERRRSAGGKSAEGREAPRLSARALKINGSNRSAGNQGLLRVTDSESTQFRGGVTASVSDRVRKLDHLRQRFRKLRRARVATSPKTVTPATASLPPAPSPAPPPANFAWRSIIIILGAPPHPALSFRPGK